MENDTWQIAANADDAMCSSSTFYTGYVLPFYTLYKNGFRWSIDIPAGSVINSAYLKIRCKTAGSGTVSSKAEVYDEDSCAAFTAQFWTRAVMAGPVVIYTNPNWSVNVWYTSTDIASLVQAFIDRPGYSPGNYLGLRVWYNSGANSAIYGHYYDQTPASAAQLEITWTYEVDDSAELPCKFNVTHSIDLPSKFEIPTTFSFSGITKDRAGNRLGNCEVALFRMMGGNPPTYLFIESDMSDGNGAYTFTGLIRTKYFVRGQKDGSPNVFDTTDDETSV